MTPWCTVVLAKAQLLIEGKVVLKWQSAGQIQEIPMTYSQLVEPFGQGNGHQIHATVWFYHTVLQQHPGVL